MIIYGILIWVALILIFTVLFYAVPGGGNHLVKSDGSQDINFFDYLYFSVVTATTTGYGDIVPVGFSRVLAILEIILGWTTFAFVMSKLVSIKQEEVLQELREISHREETIRIRSSLLLFRQDIGILKHHIADSGLHKRERIQFSSLLTSFDFALKDFVEIVKAHKESMIIDEMVNFEVVINSACQSIGNVLELGREIRRRDYKVIIEENRGRLQDIIKTLESVGSIFYEKGVEKNMSLEELSTNIQKLKGIV